MVKKIQNHFASEVISTLLIGMILALSFLVWEPTTGRAATDEFIVNQTINAELAISSIANDVTMTPSIAGITGGTANGTSTIVVITNNDTGYNMTIGFSSTTAMLQNGGSGYISNYAPTTPGTPDYSYDTSEVFGQFGYSVVADSAGELDPTFRDDGVDCGTGANNTAGTCWYNPAINASAETIINSSAATSYSGSTTTIQFRVHVPASPNPSIPAGVYTATTTLTALMN